MEKILDGHLIDIKPEIAMKLFENIHWWEKNRFLFNVIVGIAGLIPMVFTIKITLKNHLIETLICILIYGICANVFFSVGWGIDVIKWYYFKNDDFGKYKTGLCFWGIFLSAILTLFISTGFFIAAGF